MQDVVGKQNFVTSLRTPYLPDYCKSIINRTFYLRISFKVIIESSSVCAVPQCRCEVKFLICILRLYELLADVIRASRVNSAASVRAR